MGTCSRSGNLEVLEWAKENHFRLNGSFLWASGSGHVHVLTWLVNSGITPKRDQVRKSFQSAVMRGHKEVLEWMEVTGWKLEERETRELYFLAAIKGHVEILRWLKEKGNPMREVCMVGARNGHLGVVKWGMEEGGEGEEWEENVQRIMHSAVLGGSLETITWVHGEGGKLLPEFYSTCALRFKQGTKPQASEIFDFFENHGCPLVGTCPPEVWDVHLRGHDSDVLEWQRSPSLLPRFWQVAVESSSLASLQWLKEKGCPRDEGEDLFTVAKQIWVAEWLKEEGFVSLKSFLVDHEREEEEVTWWLVREGYKLCGGLVREWVGRGEWGKVKRAIEEGFEMDEGSWRELGRLEEMRDWVGEDWMKEREGGAGKGVGESEEGN
jgi:hypothetical protein